MSGNTTDTEENERFGIVPGVSKVPLVNNLCVDHTGAAVKTLAFFAVAPEWFLLMGFLGGVWLVVRRAQRHGLFSRAVAGAARGLGWWVIVGGLVVATVQAFADSGLVSHMVRGHHWFDVLPYWHTSTTGLLAGVGVLTIARVMRRAVDLQAEIDATV